MKRFAILEGEYRYSLTREWDTSLGKMVFIMLNPSLADSNEDDPTTKRCIYFAKKFGFGSLEIVNLFAYITPYPADLTKLDKDKAIGSKNNRYIVKALNSANRIVASWGKNGKIHKRSIEIEGIIKGYDIDSLGVLTKGGQPRHPLYLSNEVELLPYYIDLKERLQTLITLKGEKPKHLVIKKKDWIIYGFGVNYVMRTSHLV